MDHWIAFLLLGLIGLNMVRESRSQEEEEVGASFAPKAMLPLAVATSIDALTVGITFAFLQVDILWAVTLIGVTTFVLSAIGVKAGGIVGERGKSRAELAGGIVLILMGCKILVEHLGLIYAKKDRLSAVFFTFFCRLLKSPPARSSAARGRRNKM